MCLDAGEVLRLNLMKVSYDHLQNQHKWDSAEIANYVLLKDNLTGQLTQKDWLIKDQSSQIDIYRDLATSCQSEARKNLLGLTKVKTQRNILGYGAIVLGGVIAGLIYFRN